jgi:hypothetical protein
MYFLYMCVYLRCAYFFLQHLYTKYLLGLMQFCDKTNYIDNIDIYDANDTYTTNIKEQMISMILKNAINLGWNIEQESSKVYILKKKVHLLTKNEISTEDLVDTILDINKFKYKHH